MPWVIRQLIGHASGDVTVAGQALDASATVILSGNRRQRFPIASIHRRRANRCREAGGRPVFQLALQRLPTPDERQIALNLLHQQRELALAANPGRKDADQVALRALCLVLFNLNEFVYVD